MRFINMMQNGLMIQAEPRKQEAAAAQDLNIFQNRARPGLRIGVET
ncbi:MAG: hypothetical protein K2X27_03060 [Candidatus Obscuribacterales bacterium]|nr:hypothetical protein [Candidatus Obscuribacterales bacterium]